MASVKRKKPVVPTPSQLRARSERLEELIRQSAEDSRLRRVEDRLAMLELRMEGLVRGSEDRIRLTIGGEIDNLARRLEVMEVATATRLGVVTTLRQRLRWLVMGRWD